MISALLSVLASGFSLLNRKDARKYQEKVFKLEKEYYAESNKKRPDDAVLDNIRFELQLIANTFNSQAQQQNLENQ
jgi:hypothetical protein